MTVKIDIKKLLAGLGVLVFGAVVGFLAGRQTGYASGANDAFECVLGDLFTRDESCSSLPVYKTINRDMINMYADWYQGYYDKFKNPIRNR